MNKYAFILVKNEFKSIMWEMDAFLNYSVPCFEVCGFVHEIGR